VKSHKTAANDAGARFAASCTIVTMTMAVTMTADVVMLRTGHSAWLSSQPEHHFVIQVFCVGCERMKTDDPCRKMVFRKGTE